MRFLVLVALVLAASSAQARDLTSEEKGAVADSIKRDLKDPDSAQFKWMPFLEERGTGYCGLLNSKNTYGGYTGFEPFTGLLQIADGKVVGVGWRAISGGPRNTPDVVAALCAEDGYADLSAAIAR